jgi:hypothetical protein
MRNFRRRTVAPTPDEETEPRDTAHEGEVVDERDVTSKRWTPATLLAVTAGAALAAVGVIALTRTELDRSWYRPVEQVAEIDHTPLLAAIEIGVGALLVIFALAGFRSLATLVCLAAGIAALVAAIDPEQFSRELAIERPWAIVLAAGAGVLALLMVAPWPTGSDRTVRREHHARPVQQH